MTVTGHPDWLPAITVVDQPSQIWLALNQAVPHTSFVSDVRRWASFQVSIQYEAANAGPPAATGIFTIEWADTAAFNNVLVRHVYEINSINSTDCGRTSITDGMYGPFMRMSLAAGNGVASTFTAVMYGSNRPFFDTRALELATVANRGISTDRHIVLHDANVVASGTNYRNVKLGVGVATILIVVSGPGGPIDVLLHSPVLALNGGRCYQVQGAVSGTTVLERFTLPRRCQALRITNASAVDDVTVRCAVTVDSN